MAWRFFLGVSALGLISEDKDTKAVKMFKD